MKLETNRIGQSLGTVCCSDRSTAFYKNPFLPLIALHPAVSLPQAASRILCNTLHKVREAPFAKGRTRTDLTLRGRDESCLRSSKTVRLEVRPGWPPCPFTHNLSFSNRFPLNPSPLPCDLRDRIFRKGNRPLQSCQDQRTAASDTQKSSSPSVERIFSDQPCPIVPHHLLKAEKSSRRSQTDRTEGYKKQG